MRDSEEVYDLESMTDADIRSLVLERLKAEGSLDLDGLEVDVGDGVVRIAGRVGTEDEVEAVERIVVDILGVDDFENELVVDELVRQELSEAADDAAVESDRIEGERHTRGDRTEPSAEHLVEDVEGDLYGTDDMQKAIEQGESYSPPDAPHEEGIGSRENH